MDENRTDLKSALGELAAEEAEDIGPHAGLKRLIAYRRGTLPAAEREALQEHLSLCKQCAERLLELRDFEAASAGGGAAGPESLRQTAWESLSQRLPWKVSPIRPITGGARRKAQTAVASREIEVSVAPRFVLRGQETPESGFLRGGGAVNAVRIAAQADRFTVALNLDDHPAYEEYRLELVDRDGDVLWTGRRPGKALLGDAGTTVSVQGLGPGRYRLRIEGLQPDRTELLAEYVLSVGP